MKNGCRFISYWLQTIFCLFANDLSNINFPLLNSLLLYLMSELGWKKYPVVVIKRLFCCRDHLSDLLKEGRHNRDKYKSFRSLGRAIGSRSRDNVNGWGYGPGVMDCGLSKGSLVWSF